MRFERLTSPQHPLYKRAMVLYADSFPPHEQRETLRSCAFWATKPTVLT